MSTIFHSAVFQSAQRIIPAPGRAGSLSRSCIQMCGRTVREDLFAQAGSSIVFTSGCAENRRSLEESNMRIRQQEHQHLAEILNEELEEAGRRITDRLSELERRPVASKDDSLDGVRRFYQYLTDNDWTEADEQALGGLAASTEEQ